MTRTASRPGLPRDVPKPSSSSTEPLRVDGPESSHTGSLILHGQPGFPDSNVHAVVAAIPSLCPGDPFNFKLFEKLGMLGVRTKADLDMLSANLEQTKEFLLKKGISFLEFIVIRHHLLLRARRHRPETGRDMADEPKMLEFLKQYSPPLEHLSSVLRDIGIQNSDLEHLSSLDDAWPAFGKYLLSHGLQISEYRSLRRAVPVNRRVDLAEADSNPEPYLALQIFLKALKGDLNSKVDAFVRAGLCYSEDLNMVCVLPEEQIDEILDGLIKEGLSWTQCKAVREGLKDRAEGIAAGRHDQGGA
ncbi:hypothetical protein EIP91_012112 [Steccherinum ochraceum]|uniref:Uncharacterized protein n=1 Tax=Steccherinum ochraceum TaxID=92696 RepID=A0A4R0S3B9_9APHY|nr:hypothetical protein EIP91_012112 [Steccherinum ochraceum]